MHIEGLDHDSYVDWTPEYEELTLDGRFSYSDIAKIHAAVNPETAQLQARVAELEAALREYRRLSVLLVRNSEDVDACDYEADRLLK